MELYGAFVAEGNEIQSCSRTLKISNLEKYQNSKKISKFECLFRVNLERITNLFCIHVTKKKDSHSLSRTFDVDLLSPRLRIDFSVTH
jgi:hypothetical protein